MTGSSHVDECSVYAESQRNISRRLFSKRRGTSKVPFGNAPENVRGNEKRRDRCPKQHGARNVSASTST
jgi:hypothetical protein